MVFRPSIAVFTLLTVWLTACKPATTLPPGETASSPPWFVDDTARVGLDFNHDSGATGNYFMPEVTGSGGALLDFNNDGRLDLYLIQNAPSSSQSKNQLYQQTSDGRFENVSSGSGVEVAGYGMGAAVGDVNNDGLPDLFLTEFHKVRLFLNRGTGRFEDVTSAAGIDNTQWATAAAFFDYDRDGWLDLVIANYVDYDAGNDCPDTRDALDYCGPQGMQGTVTKLFRNRGPIPGAAVSFEDRTIASGLANRRGPALGLCCADFNGDRWPDLFVADDGMPNRLFLNQQNGTFRESASLSGIAYDAMGATAGNMGVAFGDVDGNQLFDVFVTHLAWEQHSLWLQGPAGMFQDRTARAGLAALEMRGTGFGAVMADFNNDGALDLTWVNGHIKRSQTKGPFIPGLPPFWEAYAQPRQLFVNDGTGRFRDVSANNPDFCGYSAVGRGLACGDLDNDGRLDLLVCNTDSPAQLFRNITRQGHWLMVRAIDPEFGGRDAYGAEITVEAGGRRWWRLVQPGYSFLVSNDPRVHFGLGDCTAADRILVAWPDGSDESFPGGPTDRFVTLKKGAGSPL